MSILPDDPTVSDAKPRLTVNGGWPRDLLSWVMALPPLLYLGAVAAGFAGFSTFVILLLITQEPVVAALPGVITAGVVWYLWAREHFGVTRERVQFFADHVVADLRVDPKNQGEFETWTIPYAGIGTLSMSENAAALRIRFDLPRPERRSAFVISLPRLTVRDQLDEIQQWIEASAPNHLFVTLADGEPQYSRPWQLDDVFPDFPTVEGKARIDRLHTRGRIDLAGDEFVVSYDGFGYASVRRPDSDEESRPFLAATCRQLVAMPVVRILAAYGLQIAECRFRARDDEARIVLGWGPVLAVGVRSGVIEQDGDTVAHVRKRGEGAVLHITRPLPVPTVLSIFLVLSYTPQLLPVQRGAALRAE